MSQKNKRERLLVAGYPFDRVATASAARNVVKNESQAFDLDSYVIQREKNA